MKLSTNIIFYAFFAGLSWSVPCSTIYPQSQICFLSSFSLQKNNYTDWAYLNFMFLKIKGSLQLPNNFISLPYSIHTLIFQSSSVDLFILLTAVGFPNHGFWINIRLLGASSINKCITLFHMHYCLKYLLELILNHWAHRQQCLNSLLDDSLVTHVIFLATTAFSQYPKEPFGGTHVRGGDWEDGMF